MFIRKSTKEDIPSIVDLLKKTLGENSTPKSINYWIWKHVDNPFGESSVLVAENNDQLTGVRAMMQWKWQKGSDLFNALRAVDTATHPDYQGKGVFSILTQKSVVLAKEEGINFIFNTPNRKSLPGYLKLGWVSAGKLTVGISFHFSFFTKSKKIKQVTMDFSLLDNLCRRWNMLQQKSDELFVPKSAAYLTWRYVDNPVINYFVFSDETLFLAMYIRQTKNVTELRISELICCSSTSQDCRKVKSLIRNFAADKKANLITFATQHKRWIPGLKISLPIGPIFVTKKINIDLPSFAHMKMVYQLGDMELF